MTRVFFLPYDLWNLTLAGDPTSKAIFCLSLLNLTGSVTKHIQLPKSSDLTSFNIMSQLLEPPCRVIRLSPWQTFWGIRSCMAHCFLPPGPFQTQKNHWILVRQDRRTLSPCLIIVPFRGSALITWIFDTFPLRFRSLWAPVKAAKKAKKARTTLILDDRWRSITLLVTKEFGLALFWFLNYSRTWRQKKISGSLSKWLSWTYFFFFILSNPGFCSLWKFEDFWWKWHLVRKRSTFSTNLQSKQKRINNMEKVANCHHPSNEKKSTMKK